ncbi:MAG: hypothetical protein U0X92_09915 [Anaerolineales bacterium]
MSELIIKQKTATHRVAVFLFVAVYGLGGRSQQLPLSKPLSEWLPFATRAHNCVAEAGLSETH